MFSVTLDTISDRLRQKLFTANILRGLGGVQNRDVDKSATSRPAFNPELATKKPRNSEA